MKAKTFVLTLWMLSVIYIFSGCLSTGIKRPVGLEPSARPLKSSKYEVIGSVTSQVSQFNLLWIWTVTPEPDMEKALLEMASQKGGDDVINIRYWKETDQWIVGTVKVMHIKGDVIRYLDE